ncbi:MAG: ABC transporter substrate-binding protein [Rhodospirillales bacterium]|nr:ABC transporter substrate-binding protein [Rhodospirillales bacterium]
MKLAARSILGPLAAIASLALLSASLPHPAWAAEAAIPVEKPQPALIKLLPPGAASKPFVLAVALGSPPDDFRDAQGHIAGWEVDIVRAATQALGLKLELRPTTFDTLIPGLQAKRFDAATGQMGVTVVREKVLDMIGTLYGNELFAALADSKIKVNSLADLCGLSVATTRGSREMVFAAQEQPKCKAAGKKPINMLAFDNGNGAAEALMSRRADLYWVGSTAISYFVAQSKGRTKVVGSYTDPSFIGVALPKGSPMTKPMQAAIQHLIDDGTYGAIVRKWGLQADATKTAELNPTQAKE